METLDLEKIYSRINQFLKENCLSSSWNAKKDNTLEIVIIHRTTSWPREQFQRNVEVKRDFLELTSSSNSCAISSSQSVKLAALQTSHLVNPFSVEDVKLNNAVESEEHDLVTSTPRQPQQPWLGCFNDGEAAEYLEKGEPQFDFANYEDDDDDDDAEYDDDDYDAHSSANDEPTQKNSNTIEGTASRTRSGRLSVPITTLEKKKNTIKRSGPSRGESKRDPSYVPPESAAEAASKRKKKKKKAKLKSAPPSAKKAAGQKIAAQNMATLAPAKKSTVILKDPVVAVRRLSVSMTNGFLVDDTVRKEISPDIVEDIKSKTAATEWKSVVEVENETETAENASAMVADSSTVTAKGSTNTNSEQQTSPPKKRVGRPKKVKRPYGGRKPLYPELKRNADGLRECPLCDKIFQTGHQIFKHYRREHKKLVFACGKCPREFKELRDRNLHEDNIHNDGTGELVCTQCGMSFRYTSSIYLHARRVHGGNDDNAAASVKKKRVKMKCLVAGCDSTFYCRTDRRTHLYACHSEKTRYCPICKKPFGGEKDLYNHIRKNHDETIMHKCKYCVREFALEESLSYHVDEEHEDKENGLKEFICLLSNCLKRCVGKTSAFWSNLP